MEFIAEYGLFLLKVITIVVGLLVVIAGIAAISRKPKPKLEVISLNKQYDEIKTRLWRDIKHTKPEKKKKRKTKDKQPCLYVIDFHGDIKASEVDLLRDAITAVLCIATSKDEVVICLESPGGTVSGYGLAAAQLQRVRDQNITLTVCIDKVAASGGYLMACVANNIVAAPFAIIGSIGVVAQMPNFHRWLKKNNIDMELLTAGQYKRTLTLFAENTEKGRKKFQEELETIHQVFMNYVLANRPQLNMEKIATGEHWLASEAHALQLVDELKTSDAYIIDKITGKGNFNAFKISVHVKKPLLAKLLPPVMAWLDAAVM